MGRTKGSKNLSTIAQEKKNAERTSRVKENHMRQKEMLLRMFRTSNEGTSTNTKANSSSSSSTTTPNSDEGTPINTKATRPSFQNSDEGTLMETTQAVTSESAEVKGANAFRLWLSKARKRQVRAVAPYRMPMAPFTDVEKTEFKKQICCLIDEVTLNEWQNTGLKEAKFPMIRSFSSFVRFLRHRSQ
jgi:CCR4-NOT transcriptional regulation complex NOT5 subunit